ncbi:MAG: hypothetical protein AB7O68_11140 [Pirellulales bacterium]
MLVALLAAWVVAYREHKRAEHVEQANQAILKNCDGRERRAIEIATEKEKEIMYLLRKYEPDSNLPAGEE